MSGYASSSAGAGAGYFDQGSSGWAHGAQRAPDFDQTTFANNLVGALGRGDDTPFNVSTRGHPLRSSEEPSRAPGRDLA